MATGASLVIYASIIYIVTRRLFAEAAPPSLVASSIGVRPN